MKNDLTTAVAVAILGIVISYFVCDMLLPKDNSFSFKTVDSAEISADVDEPDPEIFNYKAINPTVEVVQTCDDNGENCVTENPEKNTNNGGENPSTNVDDEGLEE